MAAEPLPEEPVPALDGHALLAAINLIDATAMIAKGRLNAAIGKIELARSATKRAAGQAAETFRVVDAADYADLLGSLKALAQVATWDEDTDRGEFDAAFARAEAAIARADA